MQQMCKNAWCAQSFAITDADLAFYDKVSPMFSGKKYAIPPPLICPACRSQERIIWRPELHLFQRKSDLSGNITLSKYPPEASCKVYSSEEWLGDEWDALSYGRDFDFSRPFFDQFAELLREAPLNALSVSGNENSDYVNSASWCKNCYLLSGANNNEDCYYGNFVNYSRLCVDCNFVDHCEICYECVDCAKCYNIRYSQQCSNCSESFFLFGCRGCRSCFGSVNLANREYVFLNEQLSKEQYQKRIQGLQLDRRSRIEEARTFFHAHRLKYPHKFMIGEMNEDVSGNGILRSRRAHECFDVSDIEDCSYCSWFHQAKSCMDCYAWGFPVEECYSCMEVGRDSHRVLFSCLTYNGSNIAYCYSCREGSRDVFGCVSLKRKSYCVFNKQYSKEDYEKIVANIIEHMQRTGEWGKFFPVSICPLAYNQTIAQDYFPLTSGQARSIGARWAEESSITSPPSVEMIPDSASDIPTDICDKVLTCTATGKPFKIIPQELRFYQLQGIPLPDKCFAARHHVRLQKRNPRKLWNRVCGNCGKWIETTYAPERPEIVYCEACYLKEVY